MSSAARSAGVRFHSRRHHLMPISSGHNYRPCFLSMNGAGGSVAADQPVVIRETHTLPAVAAVDSAVSHLNLAISALCSVPPRSSSGIIRLEVPIMEKAAAIYWLHSQWLLPLCYFSGRGQRREPDLIGMSENGHGKEKCLVSVAGVGSAVSFKGYAPSL